MVGSYPRSSRNTSTTFMRHFTCTYKLHSSDKFHQSCCWESSIQPIICYKTKKATLCWLKYNQYYFQHDTTMVQIWLSSYYDNSVVFLNNYHLPTNIVHETLETQIMFSSSPVDDVIGVPLCGRRIAVMTSSVIRAKGNHLSHGGRAHLPQISRTGTKVIGAWRGSRRRLK